MRKLFTKLNSADFDSIVDSKKVGLYILKNKNGMELSVTNFGARIVELFVPDRNGVFEDVVLGHNTLDKYVNFKGERFLGATIGRFGNRIAGGKFSLGGKEYSLAIKQRRKSLHGVRQVSYEMFWDVVRTRRFRLFRSSRPTERRASPLLLPSI